MEGANEAKLVPDKLLGISLTLPDCFFTFFIVVAEKGSGDVVNIEWHKDTTIFVACELVQINTADQDDILAIFKSHEMYMAQLKRQ